MKKLLHLLVLLGFRSYWNSIRRGDFTNRRSFVRKQVSRWMDNLYHVMVCTARSSLGFRPQENECLEVGKETIVASSQKIMKLFWEPKWRANRDRSGNRRKRSQPIFLSGRLSAHLKQAILDLLKKFKNVSHWTYAEMSRLDPQLFPHQLNDREENRPIKQALRNFRPKVEIQIKQET